MVLTQRERVSGPAEKPAIAVAFQGEAGAFSSIAAEKLLGRGIKYQPQETFTQVFEAIQAGVAEFAVIPIENTLYGSIHENYDNLLKYEMTIRGETTLRIEHALISKPGQQFSDIRQAFSHPVALEQCRRFFQENSQIQPVSYYDTAGSVKMLMREDHPGAAAIASVKAAEIYGAKTLLTGLEDNPGNFTRFFLLTKQGLLPMANAAPVSSWKTTLVFTTANLPGALAQALGCLACRNLNLSKLESRPLRDTPWEYLFYLDIGGSTCDVSVIDALRELNAVTSFLKVLGSYCPTL